MEALTYYLFRFFILIFRIIPFPLLYLFSDLVYLLNYYLIGYRKKVVLDNLRRSFPEKPEEEIRKLARGFYQHLSDLLVESLKAFSMKEEDVVKRYQYENTGFLNEMYQQGRSVLCIAGHYNNWEWGGIASGLQLMHRPVGFYKPLSNKLIDAYVQKTRVRGRSVLVSISDTPAVFETNYGEPVIYYMVADQCPSSPRLAHWMQFLNQDTAVLHGPEKYATLHNLPVVYAWNRKIKRGNYRITFSLLTDDPSKMAKGEISEKFMKALEQTILEAPQYYLWSHKRWKLKREK